MRRVKLTRAIVLAPHLTGDVNDKLYLSDDDAATLVNAGFAVYADGGPGDQSLQPVVPSGPAPGTLTKVGEETSQPEEVPEPPKRPYGNAPKSSWVEYAVAVDPKMTKGRAEGMTKVDLMSRYDERL
jgi:hypothetical protein